MHYIHCSFNVNISYLHIVKLHIYQFDFYISSELPCIVTIYRMPQTELHMFWFLIFVFFFFSQISFLFFCFVSFCLFVKFMLCFLLKDCQAQYTQSSCTVKRKFYRFLSNVVNVDLYSKLKTVIT